MRCEQRDAWEEAYKKKGELWSRKHEDWFQTEENELILDLGSGTGKSLEGLIGRIVSLDFSPIALKIAKGKSESTDFVCADSTKLPFRDDAFDFARASFIFGHLDEKGIIDTSMELSRVLKINSRLAFEVFSVSDGRYGRGSKIGKNTYRNGDGIIQRYFDISEIEPLFKGFKMEHLGLVEWKQKIGPKDELKRSVIRAIFRK